MNPAGGIGLKYAGLCIGLILATEVALEAVGWKLYAVSAMCLIVAFTTMAAKEAYKQGQAAGTNAPQG